MEDTVIIKRELRDIKDFIKEYGRLLFQKSVALEEGKKHNDWANSCKIIKDKLHNQVKLMKNIDVELKKDIENYKVMPGKEYIKLMNDSNKIRSCFENMGEFLRRQNDIVKVGKLQDFQGKFITNYNLEHELFGDIKKLEKGEEKIENKGNWMKILIVFLILAIIVWLLGRLLG